MLGVPLLKILGINENKNEMYLTSMGRGATNVGFSAFVIDTNTLAFKRVFGGTDTSGVNNKDQESAALEAMIPVLSDPSITGQINFGLGVHSRNSENKMYDPNTGRPNWSSKPPNWINNEKRDSHFKNWRGDLTTGYAEPCTNYSCLKVRIHDKGMAEPHDEDLAEAVTFVWQKRRGKRLAERPGKRSIKKTRQTPGRKA